MHFLLLLLPTLFPDVSLTSTASAPLACTYNQTSVRCRNSSLDRIADALLELFPLANGTETVILRVGGPERVDISDCGVVSLPNLFTRFNGSIRAVRVASSGLNYVAVNAFTGLEERLRQLDLSGNALQTVPQALQGLAALEELDLSDNQLHKADGSFLLHARKLRILRLAFNLLGGDGGVAFKPTAPTKSFRNSIGLDFLDLRAVAPTLEHLDLSENWLHAVPEMLRGPAPAFLRLRTLRLDHNRLADVPVDMFDVTPDLQALHLDANLVRTISFKRLPPGLKVLSLQENPLQCDCGVIWLLELIRRNATLTLRLPPCSTPFYLRDLTLSNIYDNRLCPLAQGEGVEEVELPSQVVYVNDRDLGSFHLGLFQAMHLLDVQPRVRALYVSWKVDLGFYSSPFNWSLILRRFDAPIYSFTDTLFTSDRYKKGEEPLDGEKPIEAGSERIFSGTIWDVEAGHFHVVCMAAVENKVHYIHLNQCKGGTPLSEHGALPAPPPPTPPTTTTLVAEATTTVTTRRPRPVLAPMNLRGVAASPTAINVTWSDETREDDVDTPGPVAPLDLDALFARPRNRWTLLWRPFAESQVFSSVAVAEPKHQLKGLEPGRGYYVCLRPRFEDRDEDDDDDEETECTEVRTAPKNSGAFTAGAVAAAGILATCATAALAVAVVCCCQPDRRACAAPPPASDANANDGTVEGVFLRTPRSGRRLTAPTIYPLATTFDIPTPESGEMDTPVGTPEPTSTLPNFKGNPKPRDLNANQTEDTKT